MPPPHSLACRPVSPVVTGAADTACGLLGAGAVASDRLLLSISTGGQLVQPVDDVIVDHLGRIHTFAARRPRHTAGWVVPDGARTLDVGMALCWLRDSLLGWHYPDAYDVMNVAAENSPPGAQGLLFLPYLVGERSPHMDPTVRLGAFFGLTLRHGQGDLVRAVMEGATFACYDAYGVLAELGVQSQSIILAGGGAKSTLWRQIVADVFGMPVLAAADERTVCPGRRPASRWRRWPARHCGRCPAVGAARADHGA